MRTGAGGATQITRHAASPGRAPLLQNMSRTRSQHAHALWVLRVRRLVGVPSNVRGHTGLPWDGLADVVMWPGRCGDEGEELGTLCTLRAHSATSA